MTLQLSPQTTGSASVEDFNTTSLMYTFSAGSPAGDVLNNSVEVFMDGVVEGTEEFAVVLEVLSKGFAVNISTLVAVVSIEDSPSDSKLSYVTSSVVCVYHNNSLVNFYECEYCGQLSLVSMQSFI